MYGAHAITGVERLVENEREIIERWCQGDRAAFDELVKRYMHDAYLTALGFTHNAEDARDLSQDAFVKAYQARKSFDPRRPFYPWLYRILKNHCLNFLQRVRKRTESLYFDEQPDRERFASSGRTALEGLEKRERIQLTRAAVERLQFEHREVIVLKNFKGFSYREMSELLDVPMGTIMSRLFYARKALQQIISDWEAKGLPASVGAAISDNMYENPSEEVAES